MSTLKLLKYNNYFNRQILFTDDYSSYVVASYDGVNFIPNDGVNTEQILNSNVSADYLLVYDNDILTSRWFIIEAERLKTGQYRYILHRDVIADNYDAVMSAPCFVEKGMIDDPTNPLLLNTEGQGYNQIKTSETLLPDASGCPWLIGYIARNKDSTRTDSEGQTTNEINITAERPVDTISVAASGIDGWEFGAYRSEDFKSGLQGTYAIRCTYPTTNSRGARTYRDMDVIIKSDGQVGYNKLSSESINPIALNYDTDLRADIRTLGQYISSNDTIDTLNNQLSVDLGINTSLTLQRLLTYDGKNVMFTDGVIYKINVDYFSTDEEVEISVDTDTILFTQLTALVRNCGIFTPGEGTEITPDADSFTVKYTVVNYRVRAVPQYELNEYMVISASRQHTQDALYDIIAMPYGEINVTGDLDLSTTAEHELAAMNAIFAELTGSIVYDVQLVPYCPLQSAFTENTISLTEEGGWVKGYNYELSYYKSGDETTDGTVIMFYIPYANFSFNISQTLGYETTKTGDATIGTTSISSLSLNTHYALFDLGNIRTPLSSYYGFEADSVTVYIRDSSTGAILEQINSDSVSIAGLQYSGSANTYNSIQIGVVGGETVYLDANDLTDRYITFIINSGTIVEMNKLSRFYPCVTTYTPPTYDTTYDVLDSIDMKVENECTMYRLVSPNYNGQFEFSVAKNGGTVDYFNVDCTYKPFTPYIHVNPNFRYMYGSDFNDSRGLICGGDFSISQISDSFSQYELQNKNYQNIFDRQIQNMDVNNKISREESIWSSIAGTLSGGATGAGVGALAGAGVGALAGGIGGTVASAVGGIADYQNLIKRQEEAKSFSIDMYNYNLQNIQALPYSLTKVSALTYNNKYFPFIEKYTASDVEKEALRNKITYEGMTVGVIGTLDEYSGGYVKGRLIRLSDITDDSQMAYAIYDEVNKGLYLEV